MQTTTRTELQELWSASLAPNTSAELTDIEKGYLAGIIDGEGWIGLVKRKDKRKRPHAEFQAYIMVGNTNEELLRWIIKTVGYGHISKEYDSDIKRKTNRKPCRLLRFSPNQIRILLPIIFPYLIIKQYQAKIILNYLDITVKGKHRTEREWREIEKWYDEIKQLNRKGRNNV